MDFDRAAELADRISEGENGGLHKELLDLCMPYLMDVRFRFGFHEIPRQEVVEELALDAINETIFFMGNSRSVFGIRLQNAFRACCRQRRKHRRSLTAEELAEKCGLTYPVRTAKWQPSPDLAAEQKEWIELLHHEKTSKTAIYERMRGSPYQEIAMVLGNKNTHQSRALFWDDVKQIRKNLHLQGMKDHAGLQGTENRQPIDED